MGRIHPPRGSAVAHNNNSTRGFLLHGPNTVSTATTTTTTSSMLCISPLFGKKDIIDTIADWVSSEESNFLSMTTEKKSIVGRLFGCLSTYSTYCRWEGFFRVDWPFSSSLFVHPTDAISCADSCSTCAVQMLLVAFGFRVGPLKQTN